MDSSYPRIFRVRQAFDATRIEDVPGTTTAELQKLGLGQTIQPGSSVAITAGSRGIANIKWIIKSIVEAHGGEVSVDSEAGQTSFRLVFPDSI